MIHRCKLTKLVYRDITPEDEDYEDAVEAGVTARTVEEDKKLVKAMVKKSALKK